jgi:O-antigen/teichoic acid export membrane protein
MASSRLFPSLSFNRRIGRRSIRHNALAKLASELVGRLASFALVLFAARQLGEAGFGLYNYTLAWGFVLAQLADLGLQLVITRELAAQPAAGDPQNAEFVPPSSLVQIGLQLKLVLSIVVALLMLLLTSGWDFPERIGLLCLGLTPLFNTFIEFTGHVFRGRQDLLTEARLLTAARLTTAVLGILILWLGGNLLGLGVINLITIALFVALSLYLLRRNGWLASYEEVLDYRTLARQWTVAHNLLGQALPLGIAIFLSIAYTRLAILLLQALLGEVAVAHFSAAARLVEPAQIVPASLMAAVFPAFTLALRQTPQEARRMGMRATLLLFLLGIGVAATFWLLAPWLIVLLYGNAYADSVGVLRILSLSILPVFINYSLTHYLVARGQQGLVAVFTGTMLLLHGVLCWWAIPRFGIIGPAASIILVETFLFCACVFTLSTTRPRTGGAFGKQTLTYFPTSTQP